MLPGLKAEFAIAYKTELDASTTEKIATVINPDDRDRNIPGSAQCRPCGSSSTSVPTVGTANTVTLSDKTFESTIAVDRKAIEDDQLDLIRLRIRDLAYRVAGHRHQIVVESLAGGFSGLAYDGLSFFHTAHVVNGANVSNKTTSALSATSLADGINAMMLVPDDQGTPLGTSPDTLVVGPKLQWAASELVESPVVVYKGNASDNAGSTPYRNALQGRLKLVVSPFLAGAWDDYWFLLDTKRPIRGVILQQRSDVPVEFSALEAGNSDSAFMRDRYYYGVRARYNVGYGLWQTAYGAIL